MKCYKITNIVFVYFCLMILGYDSDDDVFSSAPTSPCSEYSSSDESDSSKIMFHNAERDFSYLLFSR